MLDIQYIVQSKIDIECTMIHGNRVSTVIILDLKEWDTNNILIKFCGVISKNNKWKLIFTTVHNMMYRY